MMIEIEEIMPLYLSKVPKGAHTQFSQHAMNDESVKLFEKFTNRFFCYIDDYGRLICTERVKKDGNN